VEHTRRGCGRATAPPPYVPPPPYPPYEIALRTLAIGGTRFALQIFEKNSGKKLRGCGYSIKGYFKKNSRKILDSIKK